ncbi:MAG: hypothetical protein GEU73_02190 [Chloroflexi bacterium]|nr:hypothetical protein [Chloroflexota bacterium]
MSTRYSVPGIGMLVAVVILAACAAPASPGGAPGEPGTEDGAGARARTLALGVRYEINDLAPKIQTGITANGTKRLFNASFALIDAAGQATPYLAEALPQLNTDTWTVHPDGRMETTYRLRPDLSWHDGTGLVADDFVFALRVYTDPALGVFDSVPQDRIEEVVAVDARTVLIRWRTLYPDAGGLHFSDLEPLPRHLLQEAYEGGDADAFQSHAYWTREYVGAGPYRLEHWEPGSHLATVAFEGHALGRPKIDRITVRFIEDENTMLTNVLADEVQLAFENSLRFEHAMVLKGDWAASGRGVVLLDPVQPRFTNVQFRPEYANPSAILDVRVRRALAHSVDKHGINEGLFGGEIPLADQFLPRSMPYFAELDRGIVKYPYDLARAEQLMGEVGYRKGSDGIFANAAGERVAFEHWVIAGSQNERQGAIMADGWRRAGYDVAEFAIPTAQSTNGEVRATFPALSSVATGGGEANLNILTSTQIPSPSNRWRGNNRGGWNHSEYDRLWESFTSTLDRAERNRQAVEMMRMATDDVAQIFLFHNPNVTAHVATLIGPTLGAPEMLPSWNVHEWELR